MSLEGGSSGTSAGAIEAGKAFVAIGTDDSLLVRGLKGAGNTVAGWAKGIGDSFTSATSYFTGAFSSMMERVNKSIDRGSEIYHIAERMNASTEAVSGLGYALELTGKSIDSLEPVFLHIRKAAVEAAKDINGEAGALFRAMGVGPEEFLKLDLDKQLILIAETYKNLGTEAGKAQFLVGLGGKKANDLMGILKMGPEQLRDSIEEAGRLGRIVDTATAESAVEAKKNFIAMGYAISGIFNAFTKPIVQLMGQTKDFSLAVQYIATTLKGLISTLSPVAIAIFAIGAALVIVGTAAGIVATIIGVGFAALVGVVSAVSAAVFGLLSVLVAIVASPITLTIIAIVAALALLVSLSDSFAEGMVSAWSEVGNILGKIGASFAAMGATVAETFSGMMLAIRNKDFKGATEILVAGASIVWLQFKDMLFTLFDDISGAFSGMLTEMKRSTSNFVTMVQTSLAMSGNSMMKWLESWGSPFAARQATLAKRMNAYDDVEKALMEDAKNAIEDANRAAKLAGAGKGEAGKGRQAEILAAKDRLSKLIDKQPDIAFEMGKDTSQMNQVADKMAEAVRGVFKSSDFAGRLGIGPASNYAKESVKVQKDILGEVKEIKGKIEPAKFG